MALDQDTLKLGATLLGGGAAGAIIAAVITSYRNRIQPVRYRIKTTPVFAKAPKSSTLETVVTLKENGKEYGFGSLYLTELTIVNAGNQNAKEFTIGITMGETDRIVNAHCESPDRHHRGDQLDSLSPAQPKQSVDFRLIPFNRKDTYLFRLLSTCTGDVEPGDIKLSSNEPVRFLPRFDIGETLGRSTGEIVLGVLKQSISLKFK